MPRHTPILLPLALLAFLVACGAVPPTAPAPPPSPTPNLPAAPATPPTLTPITTPPGLAEINAQRARWDTRNITDYQLVVHELYAFNISMRYTVTVRGGQVQARESTCRDTTSSEWRDCHSGAGSIGQYTVPGLFDIAEQFLENRRPIQRDIRQIMKGSPVPNGTSVGYDTAYAFPARITWDLPDVYDEQVTITVESFALLPLGSATPATPAPATPTRP